MSKRAVGFAVIGLWALGFVSLLVIAVTFGGYAQGGKIENGKYFIGMNGVYSEVSRNAWVLSYIHAFVVMLLTVAAMFAIPIAAGPNTEEQNDPETEKVLHSRSEK